MGTIYTRVRIFGSAHAKTEAKRNESTVRKHHGECLVSPPVPILVPPPYPSPWGHHPGLLHMER